MAKLVATVKAILTRVVFGAHGFLAIWQVTLFKHNPFFWYLCTPILVLVFEGIFTLTIKKTQEWKWFCPSVFLYLGSVVPAIWLLELDKVERRLKAREESSTVNLTAVVGGNLKELDKLFGVQLKLPTLDTDTWVTLIEQFLMLVLIIGRWMLPKGDLTRDQLSQLLLVYIGTAADIIEFFDSFKDDTIAQEPVLVLLTLAIWSWSLLQFTVVLTATKSRKSRLSTTTNLPPQRAARKRPRNSTQEKSCYSSCCSIDVWGIVLNILLQDAPFFAFRLLLILHYRIISYMNVFFTCKNTLVIVLQLYRLYVVQAEARKLRKASSGRPKLNSVAVVSEQYRLRTRHSDDDLISVVSNSPPSPLDDVEDDELELTLAELQAVRRSRRAAQRVGRGFRQDTGYSTASSSHGEARSEDEVEARNTRHARKSRGTMTDRADVRPRKRQDDEDDRT